MKRKMVWALPIAIIVLAFCFIAKVNAEGGAVTEDDYAFPKERTYGNAAYTLIGTGMRYKLPGGGLKIYEAGLYIEKEKGMEAWKKWVAKYGEKFVGSDGKPDWAKLKGSPKVHYFLYNNSFGHAIVMYFRYSVNANQVRGAYEDSLAKSLDLKDPDVKKAYDEFLEGVSHPVKKTEIMTIRTSGNTVSAKGPGHNFNVKNAKLRQAVWKIWLGPDPIQVPLKKGLTRLLEVLGWPEG
ncbi:MAG: chalcone isomerase family protein [Pseudomonadota bacterium]